MSKFSPIPERSGLADLVCFGRVKAKAKPPILVIFWGGFVCFQLVRLWIGGFDFLCFCGWGQGAEDGILVAGAGLRVESSHSGSTIA